MYPSNYDETTLENIRKVDATIEELNKHTKQNRLVFPEERHKFKVQVNLTPKNGQIY